MADEIKKTPDVEAAAEPEKTEAEAAQKTETAAKKPAARKPAAKKPAEPKAEKAKADEAKADKAPARKPAAKKPAAKAADEKAAKPAARKPAAKKAAEPKAEKAAPKQAVRPAAAKAEELRAERPQKQKAAQKAAPEARKGAAGVATVVDATGKELETRKLTDARFAVPADVNTLHLVVRAEQAARRSGSASTKTRGEISGSTAKLYRQKGTGRARAGSVKSPVRTGGGTAFGPKPRSYDLKVNKKVARKALAMALSDRAANGRVFVAAGLELTEPSTHTVEQFLVNLDCAAPVLIVTHDEPVVLKSVRNLPYAEASEVAALSTEQVLRARSLVLTEKAFAALNEA
ncbi:MAG TPA: 50S ribosomal protein L4 [Thermoleophilia bacterium]|nr:50S ribosomal protein L4 [Thermoleophilia bacterium]